MSSFATTYILIPIDIFRRRSLETSCLPAVMQPREPATDAFKESVRSSRSGMVLMPFTPSALSVQRRWRVITWLLLAIGVARSALIQGQTVGTRQVAVYRGIS